MRAIDADEMLADESEAYMNAQIKLSRSGKELTYKVNEVVHNKITKLIMDTPTIEPRYTAEELAVFKHGISLSLLSKKSAQHWQYDEDTVKEIEFLERLYQKLEEDMEYIT